MESTAPAVYVEGVSKTFSIPHVHGTFREAFLHPLQRSTHEENYVLDGVTFSVAPGEFFGIIGPNGSGKSTLLKLLAGIYQPDRGHVEVNGKLSPFIDLGVGFNGELSARDNIRINATLLGLTPAEIRERFDDIVGFAGLERFVDQKLKNYSSGMVLRLAYSIAIQVPFDILVLDEVLAVGDQEFAQKSMATFERIIAEGKTVIFVSHGLAAISRFSDRVLLLRDGRAEMIGPPDEVIEHYKTSVAGPRVPEEVA